jgi:hypothetical protein
MEEWIKLTISLAPRFSRFWPRADSSAARLILAAEECARTMSSMLKLEKEVGSVA